RMASAYVFFETALKRPIISTRRMMAPVAMRHAQINPSPNLAPDSPEVAMVPASRKPPVAVTMPRVIESQFFIAHLPSGMPGSHGSKPQAGPASYMVLPGTAD